MATEFQVFEGLGFRVYDVGFRFQGLGFMMSGSGVLKAHTWDSSYVWGKLIVS